MLLSDRAQFDLARQLRRQGAPIGEAFAFISGLYFKGKLTYAREFARAPEPDLPLTASGALVITPTAGLRAAETAVTVEALQRFATVDIAANAPAYRTPLLSRPAPWPRKSARSARSCCLAASPRRNTSTSCWTCSAIACSFRSRSSAGRHEPRRAAAPVRAIGRGTDLRAGPGRGPPRASSGAAAADPGHPVGVQESAMIGALMQTEP